MQKLIKIPQTLMQEDHPLQTTAEYKILRIKQMLLECKAKEESLEKLPQSFLEFLKERGVDPRQLVQPIPRYVRVKPNIKITTDQLASKLGIKASEMVQIQAHFWAINPSVKINHCELYQEGLLYGMDYSSAFPVKCLDVQPGNKVLELCCAPGNKSMLIADLFPDVKITGVQISVNRGNIMKNLVKKYKLDNKIEVATADGLKYESIERYDRVLVDAQCTHEGSLKHIYKFFKEKSPQTKLEQKMGKKISKQQQKQFKTNNSNPYTSEISSANKWTRQDFQQRFLDQFKLKQLNTLQSGLLENGFRLLKEGGTIVYSTCSFDQQQNQAIVQQFLFKNSNAELMDPMKDLQGSVPWKEGSLKGTVRLSPSVSYCGGMFVAKISKKKQNV